MQDIVKQATQGEQLQSRANDAARTLDFLKGEINFSWTLVKTLESIGCVQQTLGISQNSIYNDNFEEAVDLLRKAEEELITIRSISNTVAVGLLQTSINGFRLAVLKTLEECWHVLLKTDHMKSKISIKHHIQRRSHL